MNVRRSLGLVLVALVAALGAPGVAAAAPSCATGVSFTVEQGMWASKSLGCKVGSGGPITYEIVTPPAHGTVDGPSSDGWITFNAAADYVGQDSFAYRATDSSGSVTRTVAVTITAAQPPTCESRTEQVRTGLARTLSLYCQASAAALPLQFEITRQPEHGTLTWPEYGQANGQVRYEPAPGFTGTDTFAFKATSAVGDSNEAVETIEVSDTYNELPTCFHDGAIRLRPGRSITTRIWCWDADRDPIRIARADGGGPAHGTITFDEQPDDQGQVWLTYAADASYEGADVIELVAHDGIGTTAIAPLAVEVVASSVNTAPVCYGWTIFPNSGTTMLLGPSCVDAENDPLTYSVSDPEHGTALLEHHTSPDQWLIAYTSDRRYTGADSFTYTADDGQATSEPATMDVQVQPAAVGPPECAPAPQVVVRKNQSQVVNLGCTHLGESMTIEVTRQPAHGTLVFPPGDVPPVYTPDRGYDGPDSFTFVAVNEAGASLPYTQELLVSNKAPKR